MTRASVPTVFVVAVLALAPSSRADESIPKSDYADGDVASASQINQSIQAVAGFIKDDDVNPTTCMKLKLKPGTHSFLYVPIHCTTGAELGLSQDAQGVWSVGVDGTNRSCFDYYTNYPSSQTVDGKYLVDPDGVSTVFAPTVVYCDMTGGGWTRVVGINPGNKAHQTASAVTPANLLTGGYGKLADDMINALQIDAASGYKLACGSRTLTFDGTCVFGAATTATGACAHNTTSDTGVADNSGTVGVGYASASALNGCAEHGIAWGNAGTLWVK